MTEFEVGYLAGIIDGEGSISIVSRKNIRPGYSMQVGSTNMELLEHLATIVGCGKIYSRKPVMNHKQGFSLIWHKIEDIHKICNLIDGRVIVKREQVKVMLDFIRVRESLRGLRTSSRIASKEDFDEEYVLMERMRLLNEAGISNRNLTPEQVSFLRELELVEG